MSLFRIFFLIFIAVPVLEIYLLITVGGIIGAVPTILVILLTAMIGVSLLRLQGLQTLTRLRASAERGELPALPMMEGALLIFAGALLLTPGFFTDAVGFLLLIPALRQTLARGMLARGIWSMAGMSQSPNPNPQGHSRIIEGEYKSRHED